MTNALQTQPRPRRGGFAGPLAWGAAAGIALLAGLALAVVAAVAVIVGVVVVLALHLRRLSHAQNNRSVTLEGRRTADGWVAEVAPR